MTVKLKDIVHEEGPYWVLRVAKGFEVYKNGVTHSTRCAHFGYTGDEGLRRAIAECRRRIEKDKQ